MADIFDEIDEDLKRDQMQLLWARYGKIVLAAVATIVLLVPCVRAIPLANQSD